MGHEGSGGDSSGVGTPVGLGFLIADLTKKKKKPFDPFSTATKQLRNEEQIGTVQRKIAEDARLGNPVSELDAKRLDRFLDERLKLAARFERNQAKKSRARIFERAGLAGLTLEQIAHIVSGTRQGQRIINRFGSPIFNPAPLGATGGTSSVPFVVTPAASTQSSFGGFGDLIGNIIGGATQLLPQIFPKVFPGAQAQPVNFPGGGFGGGFQQTAFPALIPPIVGGITRALPGLGAGAIGGELADAFQNLFSSGGASTQSDLAAFTDATPGSCRPKEHLKVNPCTGKSTWFTPRGRPLVFSGDMAACKRVDRVSKRLLKAMPTKPHRHTVRSRKR